MLVKRGLKAIICLSVIAFGPSSFANLPTDLKVKTGRSEVAAMIRLKDGKAECVRTAQNYKLMSKLQIPECSSDGELGEQVDAAMALAVSGKKSQTALLTHLLAAGLGCVYGLGVGMFGASLESAFSDGASPVGPAVATAGASLMLYGVAEGAIGAATTDFTGHVLAGIGGTIVCGGSISYLIYHAQ